MTKMQRTARIGAAALFLATLAACSSTGGLGGVLGGILGGQSQQQISGTVQGVDTRSQQIFLQQSNGQSISIGYDNQTQVVYQNQTYSVNSLERGDQVTARIANSSNNAYYTDYIQVDRSVSSSGTTSGNVQTIQGNVRQVDVANGWFSVNAGNSGVVTAYMPYNPSRADINKFQSLRSGDYVRFYGVYLNTTQVQLRQFY
jgi:hypothetical protein